MNPTVSVRRCTPFPLTGPSPRRRLSVPCARLGVRGASTAAHSPSESRPRPIRRASRCGTSTPELCDGSPRTNRVCGTSRRCGRRMAPRSITRPTPRPRRATRISAFSRSDSTDRQTRAFTAPTATVACRSASPRTARAWCGYARGRAAGPRWSISRPGQAVSLTRPVVRIPKHGGGRALAPL